MVLGPIGRGAGSFVIKVQSRKTKEEYVSLKFKTKGGESDR
jgi:hypothetical protein